MAKARSKQKRMVMTLGPNGPMARHGWKVTLRGRVDGTLGDLQSKQIDVEATSYYKTKQKAERAAAKSCRGIARRGGLVELKIKDRTGTIRDGRTYGKDPREIKG